MIYKLGSKITTDTKYNNHRNNAEIKLPIYIVVVKESISIKKIK